MKRMKRIIGLLLVVLSFGNLSAQEISPYLIGNNAWQPPWNSGAKISELWDELDDAGLQLIRIGGNGAQDASAYTKERIADLVKDIKAIGAEPLVQVPRSFSSGETTTLISYLNGTLGLNVKYWGIGNEPNLDNDWSDPILVSGVATYIKRISSALKAYDSSVKVQGPDCAWYDNNYNDPLFKNSGTSNVAGKDANGNYYIDIFAWHKYGLKSASEIEGSVDAAINMIDAINASRPAENKMMWAIGEINSHYNNSMVDESQKVWSFESGQLFAELYGLGMRKGAFAICPWSIYEGGGNRSNGDLGMFDLINGELKARSNYYHSLMLGQNMKQNYFANADNNDNTSIVAMGDQSGLVVMIMNRSSSQSYDYSLGLNGEFSSEKALHIKVEADVDKIIFGEIESSTTQMLVFDPKGDLIKRYTYSKTDADKMIAPIIENFTGSAGDSGSIQFITPQKNGRFEKTDTIKVEVLVTSETEIMKVELYLDGLLIGTDTDTPFLWEANPALIELLNNDYLLKAVAISSDGGQLSSSLNFSVEEPVEDLVVEFTSPLNGDVFEAGSDLRVLNLTAIHSSEIDNVKLYLNDELVRQENLAPYDWGLDGQNDVALRNLSAGTYSLKAIATTNSGETGEASIIINVEKKVDVVVVVVEDSNIKVYPNPVKNNLIIQNIEGYDSITIMNANGQLLENILNTGTSLIVDLSTYSNGIYFLQIHHALMNEFFKIVKY